MFANGACEQFEQAVETGLFEYVVAAHVENSPGNQFWIEKRKTGEMLQHARVGLGEQRDVRGRVVGRRVMKRELIGEDGFSGAGFANEELNAARRESATEDGVEAANAGGNANDAGLGRTVFVHGVHVSMLLRPNT